VREPVGPVFFGSTAVGAEDDATVAPKSGSFPLKGSVGACGGMGCAAGGDEAGGVMGADERKVALGSKAGSATNRPPSMVQNF